LQAHARKKRKRKRNEMYRQMGLQRVDVENLLDARNPCLPKTTNENIGSMKKVVGRQYVCRYEAPTSGCSCRPADGDRRVVNKPSQMGIK
jgi:hypothetical protein